MAFPGGDQSSGRHAIAVVRFIEPIVDDSSAGKVEGGEARNVPKAAWNISAIRDHVLRLDSKCGPAVFSAAAFFLESKVISDVRCKGEFRVILGLKVEENIGCQRHHPRLSREPSRRWNPIVGWLGAAAGETSQEDDVQRHEN